MVSSFLAIATLLIFVSRTEAIMPGIIALGILCGLAVGPILSLPTLVLEPATRAIGMGVFVSVSYIGLVLGPALGGKYATWAGSAGAAFDFGAAALLICPFVLWVFHRFQRRVNIPCLRLDYMAVQHRWAALGNSQWLTSLLLAQSWTSRRTSAHSRSWHF